MTTDPRRPIGPFVPPPVIDEAVLADWVEELERFPVVLCERVEVLDAGGLRARYREGGWTVAEIVHHLADSHLNGYARVKWILTEEEPPLKPYAEDRWGALPDAHDTPVGVSLDLLAALHARWTTLLHGLDEGAFRRRGIHPEAGAIDVATLTGLYAWHGRHHLAHIDAATSAS